MHSRLASLQRSACFFVLLAVLPLLAGCGTHATAPLTAAGTPALELSRAIAAQEGVSDALMSREGVVGTGAALDGAGHARVLVLLERPGAASALPEDVDGVPVAPLVVGTLRPWSLTGAYRPLAIGVSAGNANECLPGTIGCVLARGPRRFLLSANHVFARQDQALIGEAIVQPSRPDLDAACGTPPASAQVATLADFEPVVYDGKTPNTMDAAIAEVTLNPSQSGVATPAGFYGTPSPTVAPAVPGAPVMKLGRTTELTHGSVKAVNVKTKITFPSGSALFVRQVLTSHDFGAFGDSGSLVVTDDGTNRPVGILIGGGNNGSAIVSPIGPILARFSATIATR